MANLKDLIVQDSATVVGDLRVGGSLSAQEVTATQAGLMSAADKTKLDKLSEIPEVKNISSIQDVAGNTAVAKVTTSSNGVVEASIKNEDNKTTSVLKFTNNSFEIKYPTYETSVYIFENNFCRIGSKLIIFNDEGLNILNSTSIAGVTDIELLENVTISNIEIPAINAPGNTNVLVFSSQCSVTGYDDTVTIKYFKNMV